MPQGIMSVPPIVFSVISLEIIFSLIFPGACKCLPGYIGFRCSKSCLEGRFGVNCSEICDCNPSNTKTCNHKDGTCHCMPGYTQRRCDQVRNPWIFNLNLSDF